MRIGRRRAAAAVAAAMLVVAGEQVSRGVEAPAGPRPATAPAAAADPISQGTTIRSAGGDDSMLSGDGRWQIYAAGGLVYVRDLVHGTSRQLSYGNAKVTPGTGGPGDVITPDGTAPDGGSVLPGISADGRYFSFVTHAGNVTPVPAAEGTTSALVVCDRDPTGARAPDGSWILDAPAPGHSYPDYRCETVFAAPDAGYPSLALDQRPRLSADGTAIVYTRLESSSTDGVWTARISTWSGLSYSSPTRVGVGTARGPTYPSASQPWLNRDGTEAVFVTVDPTAGTSSVVATTVATGQSTRVDLAPADEGGGFLGDDAFTGFSSLAVSDDGQRLAFVRVLVIPQFRAPMAAAPIQRVGSYAYLVDLATGTSQVISRDNAGAAVYAYSVGLSGDGRFLAFETDSTTAGDGTGGGGRQVVERDLTVDAARARAGAPRLPGALITAAAGCAAGRNCNSTNTAPASWAPTVPDLSLDGLGLRVGFDTTIGDLVPGDDTGSMDAFVRTWQPRPTTPVTGFGPVPLGGSTYLDVPVGVTGFGPLAVSGVEFAPATADFQLLGDTCTGRALYAGEPCSVSVRAVPGAGAATRRAAQLAVSSDQLPAAAPAGTVTATVGPPPVAAPLDTVRTSLTSDGRQSPSGGSGSMISGDGRWQVFTSATDLTGREGKQAASTYTNVYVRDLSGRLPLAQISLRDRVAASATQPSVPWSDPAHPRGSSPAGSSFQPTISADGRFVSFVTDATDVVPQRIVGTGHSQWFPAFVLVVCDRDPDHDGVFDEAQPGSQVPDYVCYPVESGAYWDSGLYASFDSTPRLSADGNRIAWVERDGTGYARVQVATLLDAHGGFHAPSAFAYAPSDVPGFRLGPARADQSIDQTDPVLSADGAAVAFVVARRTITAVPPVALVESTLPADLTASTSTRFDVRPGGTGYLGAKGGSLGPPSMSYDGRRLAFAFAGPGQTGHSVYVATSAGGSVTSVVRSLDASGAAIHGVQPALSGDGRYLAYVTYEPNSHNGVDALGDCTAPEDSTTTVACQVVARDLTADARPGPPAPSQIVSRSIKGDCEPALPPGRVCAGDDNSYAPSLDATGSEISYDSYADDLVPGDDNQPPVSSGFARPPAAAAASAGPYGDSRSAEDTFVGTWRPTVLGPAVDFGTAPVGAHRTRTVVLTLRDFGPVSLGAPAVVGPDAADFAVVGSDCAGVTLHAGPAGAPESCRIELRFTPAVPGSRTATLQLPVGRAGYPRQNPAGTVSYDPALVRSLTGRGAAPVATPSPATLDFGTPLPEDPTTKSVLITNTGTAPLVLGGGSVVDSGTPGAGTDYTVDLSGCAAPVPPAGSCPVAVTFTGQRIGVRNAVLVLTDNTLAGTTSVGLRARVRPPTVEANPAVSPVRRVVVVTGRGFAPNHDVQIGFDDNPQLTVRARANGSFVAYLVVLPNGPQGPRRLFGHSAGYSPTITGRVPFLVVLGSTDPGLGVVIRN